MKRIAIFILIAVVLSCFCGCGQKKPFEYSGNNSDLYTEAINSILGAEGFNKHAESTMNNPFIKVVEEDQFGRKMFLYKERFALTEYSDNYFLLIAQKTENGFVYFYPDFNFTLCETIVEAESNDSTENEITYFDGQDGYYHLVGFSNSQIVELKKNNDWGVEINNGKCIKQKVSNQKEDPLTPKEKNELYKEIFEKSRNDSYLYINYVTTDDEGKLLYFVKKQIAELNDYRMIIIDGDKQYNQKINDVMAYQEQLAAFKREHNWKKS